MRRDDLLTLLVDGTRGSASVGLRDVWTQVGKTPQVGPEALDQLLPFIALYPHQNVWANLRISWANLTPFSLDARMK